MRTENEKKAFAERMTNLSRKYELPYSLCIALGGEEAKISLMRDAFLAGIEKDLTDLQTSFLYLNYAEHKNIDIFTGKGIDHNIPYFYEKELSGNDIKRTILAIEKMCFGLTGSANLFQELEIMALSKRNIKVVADYIKSTVNGHLFAASLAEINSVLDKNRVSDIFNGVFYIKTGVKQVRAMWALKALGIKTVVFPYGVTVIRPYAFENAGIQKVVFSPTVSHIRAGAFYGCELTEINLPENKFLTSLGMDAFSCNKITKLRLPENIETFDMYSFRKNPITEIAVKKGTNIYHCPKTVQIKEE